MAIIKAPKVTKERLVDKTVTLNMEVWKELAAYAKYAGIGGKPADKINYIVGEALKNVFTTDAGYQATLKAEEPKKVEEPKKEDPKEAPKSAPTNKK